MNSLEIDFSQLYPWINTTFFERILRKHFVDNSITIIDFKLAAALAKGENFGSQILRANIEFESNDDGVKLQRQIPLIVKVAMADNPDMAAWNSEMGWFEREIITYQQIVPEVETILRSIGDTSQMVPKCYDSDLTLSYLVFEDLSASYSNTDRRHGLDYSHFQFLLGKLAKWHAATAVLIKQNKVPLLPFRRSHAQSETMRCMYVSSIGALSDAVLQMPGFEYLSPKLRALSSDVYQRILTATANGDDSPLTTLTHGDLWSNNVLFSYDDAKQLTDAILIDFQSAYVGAPILDVIFAFYTSSAANVQASDWDTLLEDYWREFNDVLRKLKFDDVVPIPSLVDLQADRCRRTHHALSIGLYALAARNLDEVADDEQDKMVTDTAANREHRVKMMLNPTIRSSLEYLLKFYDSNGFFD